MIFRSIPGKAAWASFLSVPLVALFVPLAVGEAAHAAPPVYATVEAAAADPDFAVQGEYAGPQRGMQVIARGDGQFELVLYDGGLPGAGWQKTPPQRIDGDADTVADLVDSLELKRVERVSPTLGAGPPPGGIVLFDGSPQSLRAHWHPGARRTDGGLLQEGATSLDTFDDYTVHLEFRTPFMPESSGQQRGNSGVYHQGRFETQVLDSFGLRGANNETGGIYTVRDPDLNMCFPPLRWQTYDVDFTAARYDDEGTKQADARMTVRLNGVVVQPNVAVPQETRAAPIKAGPGAGPIYLQDHGDPVRFRNIWVKPRDTAREARRPRVPAFERFHAVPGSDLVEGGRLLLANLGCQRCHSGAATAPAKGGPVLTDVAGRLRPDHLVAMIADPHATKPGTTMPDPWSGLDAETRQQKARAIASFLSRGHTPPTDRVGSPASAQRGETLFRTIGCLACHDDPGMASLPQATSVPLGELDQKYTLDSLAAFLAAPHQVRPDARMPRLVADLNEAQDVACYLLKDVVLVPGQAEFQRTLFRGTWDMLPDFSELAAVDQRPTVGLGFEGIQPLDRFAAVYESYLPISQAGTYTFHLGSDDGSLLLIDRKAVLVNDGIHPYGVRSAKQKLAVGAYRLRVEYFENAGQQQLSLELEGPGLGRSDIAGLVTTDPAAKVARELVPNRFQPAAELVAEGGQLFRTAGCAACHPLNIEGQQVASQLTAPSQDALQQAQGCLAETVPPGLPDYALTSGQRLALLTALRAPAETVRPAKRIARTLAALNCYACHQRDGLGGPEASRDAAFVTTTPEMGNEGRLPPPLSGVGDKLREAYLAKILQEGANERPYVKTRMPAFPHPTIDTLVADLVKVDRHEPVSWARADEPSHHRQAKGRLLMGDKGLDCIKCHTFGGAGTEGIQAIDALRMTERLREDWFHRYMLDPQAYRPGTRMPASFVEGKSVLETVYEGDPARQIAALWAYLGDGKDAKEPSGLRPGAIELEPLQRPILYRNFITGLSPRGIAVGFPEDCHFAWDAGTMALARLWQNQFIDAAKHWQGRGPGAQNPLGDAVIDFESSCAIAKLADPADRWPAEGADETGSQFLGYRLNRQGQPTFRYRLGGITVSDAPRPVALAGRPGWFRRELVIASPAPVAGIWFRAARGRIVPEEPGTFLVDDQYRITVKGLGNPALVTVDGTQELRYPLPEQRQVTFEQQIRW